MNRSFALPIRRLGLALAAMLLSSCVPYDGYYNGAVASSGQYGYRTAGTASSYGALDSSYPIYYEMPRRYPAYGYGGGYSGYGGYSRSISSCYRCGYVPCRCGSHYRDGAGYRSSSRSSDQSSCSKSSQSDAKLKHRPNSYQIAGGSVGAGRSQPKGYHSVDWYKSRGYDVSKLKLRNEKGEYYRGSSKSSSSKSSKSSSSKSSSKKK